jgi:hypothetical protein
MFWQIIVRTFNVGAYCEVLKLKDAKPDVTLKIWVATFCGRCHQNLFVRS